MKSVQYVVNMMVNLSFHPPVLLCSLHTDNYFDKMLGKNHCVDASCPVSPLPVGCVWIIGI